MPRSPSFPPRPRLTRRQRAARWAIALLVGVVLPLLAAWILLAQPSLARNSPSPAQVDPARLEAHVRMLSETLAPRGFGNRDNLRAVAGYIGEEFAAAGARVEQQRFRHGGLFEFINVSGFFGPNDPVLPRVIAGAHYDAYGEYPGADDNASGVAGVIELAGLLGQLEPGTLALPVELVCWPLEEPPFFRSQQMGSAVHARALRQDGVQVELMISLEMIGYFTDEPSSQSYPMPLLHLFYPSRGNFIAVASDLVNRKPIARVKAAMKGATPLPVHSISAPRSLPGIDFSDHLNYWAEGYPAVMVTDTAFYRNDRYHTERDTADTLDYHRMAQATAAVHEAILAAAGR